MEKTKETMSSYSIRLPSELYERIMDATTRLDLRSKNDFVRDACEFYLEWLNRESSEKFITPALESVVRGTVRDSESRIVRQLFRLAVEMNSVYEFEIRKEHTEWEKQNEIRETEPSD